MDINSIDIDNVKLLLRDEIGRIEELIDDSGKLEDELSLVEITLIQLGQGKELSGNDVHVIKTLMNESLE